MKTYLLAGLLSLSLAGCASGGDSSESFPTDAGPPDSVLTDAASEPETTPPPKPLSDGGLADGSFDLWSPETDPLTYNGGPVLVSPINVYFIWYGGWTDTKVAPILENAVANIDSTAWWQIFSPYYEQLPLAVPPDAGVNNGGQSHKRQPSLKRNPSLEAGVTDAGVSDASDDDASDSGAQLPSKLYVTGRVNFVQSVYVGYTHGTSLSDDDISTIVGETVAGGLLPPDVDGIYFVLTSADVSEGTWAGGFCSDYCAWHGNQTILGSNYRIGFVGDTGSCEWCNLQDQYVDAGFTTSPNDDWSADSMASVLLHELSESATDPDANTNVAWLDDQGDECADKCAWTFGQPYVTPNHSVANMPIGTRNYMIQQNWVLDSDGGHCALHP
jgi:Phosphate-induced protein 1 conserved region